MLSKKEFNHFVPEVESIVQLCASDILLQFNISKENICYLSESLLVDLGDAKDVDDLIHRCEFTFSMSLEQELNGEHFPVEKFRRLANQLWSLRVKHPEIEYTQQANTTPAPSSQTPKMSFIAINKVLGHPKLYPASLVIIVAITVVPCVFISTQLTRTDSDQFNTILYTYIAFYLLCTITILIIVRRIGRTYPLDEYEKLNSDRTIFPFIFSIVFYLLAHFLTLKVILRIFT